MTGFVCIHGHFYQPPRENPWLDEIEVQASAFPYRDWNDRIAVECYAPNMAASVLGPDQQVIETLNNYSRISFDFGPTLLSWLECRRPDVLGAIVRADRDSRRRYSGHGSAMAQVFNHMIAPLASRRDLLTQVRWGMSDFRHRFGHEPEGMWLPETAVDLATLEVLAGEGIRFTVLAPHQAARIRPCQGEGAWQPVPDGSIDTTRAYLCRLPSGSTISLFFYDAAVAAEVAFGELLKSGFRLADRLIESLAGSTGGLAHLATDGETYGHHHRFGEMALARCLHSLAARDGIRLTNYGEFLELRPAEWEVEVVENTAWSCAHGVERWRSDCGCHTGGKPGWNQAWRAPLRQAMLWLRDQLDPLFESEGSRFLLEPWQARDEFVTLLLDPSPSRHAQYWQAQARAGLSQSDREKALQLLAMQRHMLLSHTSCGWFFSEISGVETIQIMSYAARAIELAEPWLGDQLERGYLDRLREAPSNIYQDGAEVYRSFVLPGRGGSERHFPPAS